mgnify:CR=1 FL=1
MQRLYEGEKYVDPHKNETKAANEALTGWMQGALSSRVRKVETTARLVDSPAIVTDHESAALRRMMQMVDQSAGSANALPMQNLEINPKHPLITLLNQARESNPELAAEVAEQVLDNALVSAGLMDDSRVMLPRINKLLEIVLGGDSGSDDKK